MTQPRLSVRAASVSTAGVGTMANVPAPWGHSRSPAARHGEKARDAARAREDCRRSTPAGRAVIAASPHRRRSAGILRVRSPKDKCKAAGAFSRASLGAKSGRPLWQQTVTEVADTRAGRRQTPRSSPPWRRVRRSSRPPKQPESRSALSAGASTTRASRTGSTRHVGRCSRLLSIAFLLAPLPP